MKALVFADRVGNELLPLTRGIPVPLLPVNGKPLIGHTLEDLADADVRAVTVVVGEEQAPAVQRELGNGDRWGVDLDFAHTRSGETPSQFARRFADRLPENYLAMRGDVYRSGSIRSFRAAANNVLATQVTALINGRCAQLCLCRQRDIHLDLLSWNSSRQTQAANWRTIDMGDGEFSQLFDTTEYYLANIDGLDERVATLNAESGSVDRQCHAASGHELRAGIVRGGPVLIGKDCEIDEGVQLAGPVVLGDGVVVGEGSFLYSCVVLPGTYVPPGIRLHNAVVTGELAIGIAGDVICRFADRLDAGNARPPYSA